MDSSLAQTRNHALVRYTVICVMTYPGCLGCFRGEYGQPNLQYENYSPERCFVRTLLCFFALTQQQLYRLMDHFSKACRDRNKKVMCQDGVTPAIITIDNNELESVHQFIYLLATATLWPLKATDTRDKLSPLLRPCLGELKNVTQDPKNHSAQRLHHKYTDLWQSRGETFYETSSEQAKSNC